MLGAASAAGAGTDDADRIGLTPPRLSLVEGGVSFWRPGTSEWAPAELNTPLASGDQLVTSHAGSIEIQIAPQGFVRGWGDTQLVLTAREADHLRLGVGGGHVALDFRNLDGQTVTIETPHAIYTLNSAGYYRTDVTPAATTFTTRTGRAAMAGVTGETVLVGPGERITVTSVAPGVTRERAPAPDVWDDWNHARTDHLVAAASARYVAPGVYGASDLDQYGDWRVTDEYGAVWVPVGVTNDWTPYSSGRWITDPAYGWTWVDAAPWGWAPYHYGRWVFVSGAWAWAPGVVSGRWAYAPALVAFLSPPSPRVISGGGPVSWVPLGWREPVVPWWGRHEARRATPSAYRNAAVRNSVVTVRSDDFTRRRVDPARLARIDARDGERWRVRADRGTPPPPRDRRETPSISVPATSPRAPAAPRSPAPISPRVSRAPAAPMPSPAPMPAPPAPTFARPRPDQVRRDDRNHSERAAVHGNGPAARGDAKAAPRHRDDSAKDRDHGRR
jgi:hypothetical protein